MFRKKKLTLQDILTKAGIDVGHDPGRTLLEKLKFTGYDKLEYLDEITVEVYNNFKHCRVFLKKNKIAAVWLSARRTIYPIRWNIAISFKPGAPVRVLCTCESNYDLGGKEAADV